MPFQGINVTFVGVVSQTSAETTAQTHLYPLSGFGCFIPLNQYFTLSCQKLFF